ncbi:MAG: CopG family transcriptional regulator [Chloroflexota bacterium]
MRRLQIYIDEDMDEVLGVEARREGRSKAALIREAVRDRYGDHQGRDALDGWVGSIHDEPGDIDSVVYDE